MPACVCVDVCVCARVCVYRCVCMCRCVCVCVCVSVGAEAESRGQKGDRSATNMQVCMAFGRLKLTALAWLQV